MEPKYTKGQKVKIISVGTPHGQLKYPELEEYVNGSGAIVDSHLAKYEIHGAPTDIWGYTVRIEKDDREVTVLEDALEPLSRRP